VNILGYDPLWKSRDRARFQEKHFRLIAAAGFNHVRVNLHPWRDGKIDAENRLAADWLATLDWAAQQALKNKLLVILDLHEFQEMGRDAEGNRERLLSTWTQLAQRYRQAPEEVLFESLAAKIVAWPGSFRSRAGFSREKTRRNKIVDSREPNP
jgi:endoglucanase